MKAKKIFAWIGIGIAALLLIVIIGIPLFGAGLIKATVEKVATTTLGVPVTIKNIDLSILQGKVGIEGLVVKNPQGYANETLLELGNCAVNLDIGSLMSKTIKIELIKLENTKLTIEQKGLTNNLNEILDKLPKSDKEPEPKTKEPGKNLIVTKLEVIGTNVKAKLLSIPGKTDTLSMNLDPIIMEKLGTDSKLTIAALIGKVFGALAVGVAKQGTGLLPKDMTAGIDSAMGKTAELGKSALGQGQKALEKTTNIGKGTVEGVKVLFDGKKSEPNKR